MFKKFKEDTTQIQNLEGLLKGHINGNILKHEVRPLTEFGENFGSEMLKMDITVEENGQENVLYTVAKLIPPTTMQLEIFNTQVTFKNELGFYADIVPALIEFQCEYGINTIGEYFPKFYGGRTSLKSSSDEVDTDAAIVLENLKINGYTTIDRIKGFDLDGAKVVLKALADFHATSLALRKKKPEIFTTKVEPYLSELRADQVVLNDIVSVFEENPNTAPLIPKIRKLVVKKRFKKIREPWATITHNDIWVNNIMVVEKNSTIESPKFVDFQIIDYSSPAVDLIFFLFSSVELSVLRYHFEKLIQYFFNEFITILASFKIDTKEYTYESFQEELRVEAGFQIFHTMFMIGITQGPRSFPKPIGKVKEWNPQHNAANGHAGPPPVAKEKEPVFRVVYTLPMKEKLWYIVEEAAKRKWI